MVPLILNRVKLIKVILSYKVKMFTPEKNINFQQEGQHRKSKKSFVVLKKILVNKAF